VKPEVAVQFQGIIGPDISLAGGFNTILDLMADLYGLKKEKTHEEWLIFTALIPLLAAIGGEIKAREIRAHACPHCKGPKPKMEDDEDEKAGDRTNE
jgi:hypothetical protein